MKKYIYGSSLVVFLFTSLLLFAMNADVSGTWELTMSSGHGGDSVREIEIVQDGEKITVSIDGQKGAGTVKDNKIEWEIVLSTGMGDIQATFTGKVDGETMEGEVDRMGSTAKWSANIKEDHRQNSWDEGTNPTTARPAVGAASR